MSPKKPFIGSEVCWVIDPYNTRTLGVCMAGGAVIANARNFVIVVRRRVTSIKVVGDGDVVFGRKVIVNNDALGGGSAFTVGKYLSPRLYFSYGVGLFDPGQVITLRYHISGRWNFEALTATEFSRASINYRFER